MRFLMFVSLALAAELLQVSGKRCYDDLGCFETPWFSCHDRNPDSPEEIVTTFKLFTKENRTAGQDLDRKEASSISNSFFNPRRDTKFLVHGWTDSMNGGNWIKMRDAFLNNFDVNVVMVDWNKGASKGYFKSRANTRVVGREIASLIELLTDVTSAPTDSMHIIGHSLGAHVAGYAGEWFTELTTDDAIGRISGLDPAGPDFGGENVKKECRLDRTDAAFVDVIHTDGDLIVFGGLGLMDELGHQDFYPNGGRDMPGCPKNGELFLDVSCDHLRAVEYYIESISNPAGFKSLTYGQTEDDVKNGGGNSCESANCPQMGFMANKNKYWGTFYLTTKAQSPYSV